MFGDLLEIVSSDKNSSSGGMKNISPEFLGLYSSMQAKTGVVTSGALLVEIQADSPIAEIQADSVTTSTGGFYQKREGYFDFFGGVPDNESLSQVLRSFLAFHAPSEGILPWEVRPIIFQGQPVPRETRSLTTSIEIAPEAAQRVRGHEELIRKACSLATEEARKHNLVVLSLKVHPDWSHEYEETAGVVVDIKIKATDDERFSYWDTVCERIESLSASLSSEGQEFLNKHLSLAVRRG